MTQQATLHIAPQSDGTYRLPSVVRVSEEIGVPSNGGPVRLYLTVETGDELELPVAQDAISALRSAVSAAVQVVHEAPR
jgi:hypothetical protein